MGKSENIDQLASALAKAQSQLQPVKKTGRNPHLGNEYATLDDIIGSSRKPLTDNGLAYTQLLQGKNGTVKLTTMLMHESGQWLSGSVVIKAGAVKGPINEVQALGRDITYMKRYALAALLGIAAETDDDGNGHQQPKQARPAQKQQKQSNGDGGRPFDPETLRQKCREHAGWIDKNGTLTRHVAGEPISEGQTKAIPSLLGKALPNLDTASKDKARHQILEYIFGVDSTTALMRNEASTLIRLWKHADDGNWDLNRYAVAEVAQILNALAVEAGQQELGL